MDSKVETGTIEDFAKAVNESKFIETPPKNFPLDAIMAETRLKLDNAIQAILTESALPIYLFDYLLTSIQADMRKADADILRMGGSKNGDTK